MIKISERERPEIKMRKRKKGKQWYSVKVLFEYDIDESERARFIHAGDAYKYAQRLQEDYLSYAETLKSITVEW